MTTTESRPGVASGAAATIAGSGSTSSTLVEVQPVTEEDERLVADGARLIAEIREEIETGHLVVSDDRPEPSPGPRHYYTLEEAELVASLIHVARDPEELLPRRVHVIEASLYVGLTPLPPDCPISWGWRHGWLAQYVVDDLVRKLEDDERMRRHINHLLDQHGGEDEMVSYTQLQALAGARSEQTPAAPPAVTTAEEPTAVTTAEEPTNMAEGFAATRRADVAPYLDLSPFHPLVTETVDEVGKQRVRRAARRFLDAEEHAKAWRPPGDHGALSDELELPEEPEQWRLRGLLGVGHNALLVATKKAGKTTMVNSLVRSYVDGEPFLGQFEVSTADATVAVFNYEVDQKQYRRWLREAGIVNTDLVHVLHLRGKTLPLKSPRVQAWVTDWLRERNVGLWILDPYSRAYVGSLDNGNDDAQVGSFLDTLDVIKAEAGVSELVMPAHTPKARVEPGEETAIGSQRLEAWPDALWYLTKDLVTGVRFLRADGRDVDVPEQKLTFDPATRSLTLGGSSRASIRQDADVAAVVAYVTEHAGCTGNDIKGGLEWGRDRVNRALARTEGLIRNEPGKNRSRHYFAVDLSSGLESPDQSGPSVQSGGLGSIETTTGLQPTTSAEEPLSCIKCGRPAPYRNPNTWLCAACEEAEGGA